VINEKGQRKEGHVESLQKKRREILEEGNIQE